MIKCKSISPIRPYAFKEKNRENNKRRRKMKIVFYKRLIVPCFGYKLTYGGIELLGSDFIASPIF